MQLNYAYSNGGLAYELKVSSQTLLNLTLLKRGNGGSVVGSINGSPCWTHKLPPTELFKKCQLHHRFLFRWTGEAMPGPWSFRVTGIQSDCREQTRKAS